MILKFVLFLLFTLASASENPVLVGQGLTRVPEDGIAELDQVLSCSIDGQTPDDLQWLTIKNDGTEEALVLPEDGIVKATDAELTYRCKVDDDTYADFIIGKYLQTFHNSIRYY